MLILGLSGGLDLDCERRFDLPYGSYHDSAAVLLEDGVVVAGIEEERLNRIKHTNKGPLMGVKFCLESRDLRIADIDVIALNKDASYFNGVARSLCIAKGILNDVAGSRGEAAIIHRSVIKSMLERGLNEPIGKARFQFVPHHLAHASSAYLMSGYSSSLILSVDGLGDGISGVLANGDGDEIEILHTFPPEKSLGNAYERITKILGFREFDEFKVMGLASYGDPKRLREFFKTCYTLRSEGDFELDIDGLYKICFLVPPRANGGRITQEHMDVAAGMQEMLETIVLHVLRCYKEQLGSKYLCLAGGVALNSSMNHSILSSGLFSRDVFVQPAAHDAGGALGAALYAYNFKVHKRNRNKQVDHVYWGTDVGDRDEIVASLRHWGRFIVYEEDGNIAKKAARLLADGEVIGWMQGRSEFGPRALGNRSILADPRPERNRDVINRIIKKRETFRPFAPSVLFEDVEDYFDVCSRRRDFPFMTCLVRVREEKRDLLRAVTHVDGTARIQTVSRDINPMFWQLLDEFRKLTGVPVLLNTSFNNSKEPIVDSIQDGIVCFLTSALPYLVVGNFLVSKKDYGEIQFKELVPTIPRHIRPSSYLEGTTNGKFEATYEATNTYCSAHSQPISAKLFELMSSFGGGNTLGEIFAKFRCSEEQNILLREIEDLWEKRAIELNPSTLVGGGPAGR